MGTPSSPFLLRLPVFCIWRVVQTFLSRVRILYRCICPIAFSGAYAYEARASCSQSMAFLASSQAVTTDGYLHERRPIITAVHMHVYRIVPTRHSNYRDFKARPSALDMPQTDSKAHGYETWHQSTSYTRRPNAPPRQNETDSIASPREMG